MIARTILCPAMRFLRRLLPASLAILLFCGSLAAQSPLPLFEPYNVRVMTFRPGSTSDLLMGVWDNDYRLQAHLVRIGADGKPVLVGTLPGFHAAVAWLDADSIVTSTDKGLMHKWPAGGGPPTDFAALAGPVTGIGVAPRSRTVAVRMQQGPIRFLGGDGKPAGPALSIGAPQKAGEECAADGMETTPVFSSDERLIAFAGLCAELRVSGREGGRLVRPDPQRPFVKRHAVAADGKTLLVAYTGQPGGGADFWPIFVGRLGNPKPMPGPIEHDDPADLAALPDNAGFAVLSTHRLRFVSNDGQPLRPDIAIARPKRIAISTDGTRIAVAAEEGLVLFDRSGKRLSDRPFAELGTPVATVALAKEFAAISREGTMRFFRPDGAEARAPVDLWDATKLTQDQWGEMPRVLAAPNGRVFAVHAPNGRFELFDDAGQKLGRPFMFPVAGNLPRNATTLLDDRILRPLPGGAGFVAFTFDGRVVGQLMLGAPTQPPQSAASANGTLATMAYDRRLRLWNSEGKLLRERALDDGGRISDRMDFAANGRAIAVHDGWGDDNSSLLVWRLALDSDSVERLPGAFVRFLPDGRLVRFTKGKLTVGTTMHDVDADQVHAVATDGSAALVSKNGVARMVPISR
jgi:hypothetical protein